MCMGGSSGGYRPPSQGQNQANLDIENGVVKQGDPGYEDAQRARRRGIFGSIYKGPNNSLLAPESDSTLLGT